MATIFASCTDWYDATHLNLKINLVQPIEPSLCWHQSHANHSCLEKSHPWWWWPSFTVIMAALSTMCTRFSLYGKLVFSKVSTYQQPYLYCSRVIEGIQTNLLSPWLIILLHNNECLHLWTRVIYLCIVIMAALSTMCKRFSLYWKLVFSKVSTYQQPYLYCSRVCLIQ